MTQQLRNNLLEDYHLLSYDVLDSTNEEAKRLADGGAAHGAVIWAKRQTSGKGRMGREWVSHEGNLFVTILLSPNCDLLQCSQLSFVASVAVANTVDPIIPDDGLIQCKWPNDVLYDGKKLGGILLESFSTLNEMGEEQTWVAVGVGINIDSYPEDTSFPATCLRQTGVEIVSAKIVLSRFVYNFIHAYDLWCDEGFDPIRRKWIDHAYKLGNPTEVAVGNDHFSGNFQGIDECGRLLLAVPDGSVKPISAGDVIFSDRNDNGEVAS
ncbi:MAG: biotin--[acetyl-CoA-carboxylase] ligase [Rickettsiales bacterium]|nr:biotin--[acetyl-CoA-carboxylase] ligase [Rickettsiales bacterium]